MSWNGEIERIQNNMLLAAILTDHGIRSVPAQTVNILLQQLQGGARESSYPQVSNTDEGDACIFVFPPEKTSMNSVWSVTKYRPEYDIQNIISDLGVECIIQSTEEDDRDVLGSQLVGGSIQQQGLARPVVSDDHQEERNVPSLAVWVQDLV